MGVLSDEQQQMPGSPAPRPAKTIGVRHRQICIMFFGLSVAYMMRANLSVGIVAMTDPAANPNPDIQTVNYTTEQKGILSGMFFYGYLISGIPAGLLVDMYGPVKLLSIVGGIFCGLVTLGLPFIAVHFGFKSVCALRILMGLAQGLFFPSINAILGKWSTPQDRGEFTWVFSGAHLGTIIMWCVGGGLASSCGWPSIFIYSGLAGVLWGIFSLIFAADSPSTHKSMPLDEKLYILSNQNVTTNTDQKSRKIPWGSIVTSVPFVTLAVTHTCQNWGFFILLTMIPTYIHGVYDFPIAKNGFLSSLPYIGMVISGFILSPVASRMEGKFSRNFIRKFFNSIGYYGPALALGVLWLFKTNAAGAISLLTIASVFNAGVNTGFTVNHLDLAPNFAGILMGTTNALSNIASIGGPLLAGILVTDESNNTQWQIVFLISAAVYVLGNTLFLIFGSTEMQEWNNLDEQVTDHLKNRDVEASTRNTNGREEEIINDQKNHLR